MNLVIVESPAKAKTINKYLGNDYTVLASYGHIRDLPSKNGSVDPENEFKMIWEIDSFSKKYLKEISDVAKDSKKIILATDPDREGEAIAWHVKEFLNEKKLLKDKKIERVVFNEITKKAVTNGIENPREIESDLVNAYMARRALDYLVGFNISPILWTKLPGSKSAGRVQSVALRLLTEREHEIEIFKPEEFWSLKVNFKTNDGNLITSNIFQINNKKIEKFSFKNKNDINQAIEKIKKALKKIINQDVKLNVVEVKQPDLDAQLVADSVTQQLEKRIMFRKAMKRAVQNTMRQGAKGIRIEVSGRLNGAEIARSEWYREGRVPLHTLKADIDYATSEALTTYGILGVKVWIYRGDKGATA